MPLYEALVRFDVLVNFSVDYMGVHAKDVSSRQPNLVYLKDHYDGSISMSLLKKGVTYRPDPLNPASSHRLYDELGSWSGYPADCPFDFCWKSCTDSVLIAVGIGGKWLLECLPSRGRDDCNFRRDLARFGAEFRRVVD